MAKSYNFKKTELDEYLKLKKQLDIIERNIEFLKAKEQVCGINYKCKALPSGGGFDAADIISRRLDLEKEYMPKKKFFLKKKANLYNNIKKMQEQKLKEVLMYRYIEFLTVAEVANMATHSLRYTQKLLKTAVKKLDINF